MIRRSLQGTCGLETYASGLGCYCVVGWILGFETFGGEVAVIGVVIWTLIVVVVCPLDTLIVAG